ncbi:MAG TPA: cell envelope integrity protein TolA, partial [Burkholderiales bacterium]|nr:cell envelope integrity protein TolA [Burkholderiales bacterium]
PAEPAPQPPRAQPEAAPRERPKPAVKPDIALREKKEQERKVREQELLEKRKREQEQARLAAQREREAREAEAKRLAQEQAEALKKLAQQQATARAAEIEKYKGLIRDRIRRYIIEPPNLQGNPEAELDIIVLPGGEVLDVRTRRASGQPAWDNAVERAIRRAQPLPLPPDPALFREFRELNLKFRPKE